MTTTQKLLLASGIAIAASIIAVIGGYLFVRAQVDAFFEPSPPTDEVLWTGTCGGSPIELRQYFEMRGAIEVVSNIRVYLRWERDDSTLELEASESEFLPRNHPPSGLFRYRALGRNTSGVAIYEARESERLMHLFPRPGELSEETLDELHGCLEADEEQFRAAVMQDSHMRQREQLQTLVLWNREPRVYRWDTFRRVDEERESRIVVGNPGAFVFSTRGVANAWEEWGDGVLIGGLIPADEGMRLHVDLTRAGLEHSALADFRNTEGQSIEEYFDRIAITTLDDDLAGSLRTLE